MSLQGDLSTLDLAGLFQNLEGARKNGVLTIGDRKQPTHLLFHEGRLNALNYPDRASVAGFLAAAGVADAAAIERARKRGRRHLLLDLLADAGVAPKEQLVARLHERITDEACDILMTQSGRFEFHEGEAPEGLFDADERGIGLALPASALLLEAARRSDHWKRIRTHVPSDATHYELARQPREIADAAQAAFAAAVLELIDGSRSVGEIAANFPHCRFALYELLANLSATGTIKPCDPSDMGRRIRALAGRDKKRAWELVERALALDPRSLPLLSTKAQNAEALGRKDEACEALKLVAHLELERGALDHAREALQELKRLAPKDPVVWEKGFELALRQRRTQDALADARQLIDHLRAAGLHKRARGVLERVIGLAGETWERVRQMAELAAEGGDVPAAVAILERFARARLDEDDVARARRVYSEILAIDPRHARAKETLAEIDSGALQMRRAKWRKIRRRAALVLVAIVLLPALGYEALARRAVMDATREIVRGGWIEEGRYADAIERYNAVRAQWAWSTAAVYEVPQTIAVLEARRQALPPP